MRVVVVVEALPVTPALPVLVPRVVVLLAVVVVRLAFESLIT